MKIKHLLLQLTVISLFASLLACNQQQFEKNSQVDAKITKDPIRLISGGYKGLGAEGIYEFTLDAETLKFSQPQLILPSHNPSFMVAHNKFLYAVSEIGDGQIKALSLDNNTLTPLNQVSSMGASPCYLSLSPNKRFIAAANFMGGNASILKLDNTGTIAPAHAVLQDISLSEDERHSARAHWVGWSKDGKWVYVVYHGSDKVMAYPFDADTGKTGTGQSALDFPKGDGPRLMMHHPKLNLTYIISQTSMLVTVAKLIENGKLEIVQRISSVPEDFKSKANSAHIYVSNNGKYVYTSNRGHNSITVFSVGENGILTKIQTIPSGGDGPRFFLVLDALNLMLVANRNSNQVKLFEIRPDGILTPTENYVDVPAPVFIGNLNN